MRESQGKELALFRIFMKTQSNAAKRVTQILEAVSKGQSMASEELLPLVYAELRELARHRMAQERIGHTLQATALVHEAYLRLVQGPQAGWENRGHFFVAAATAMKRILIEKAREKAQLKRGGEFQRITVSALEPKEKENPVDVLDLDSALKKLKDYDARKAQIVELRYFAGLNLEEIAQALQVSLATVKSDWSYAKAWLYRELSAKE